MELQNKNGFLWPVRPERFQEKTGRLPLDVSSELRANQTVNRKAGAPDRSEFAAGYSRP